MRDLPVLVSTAWVRKVLALSTVLPARSHARMQMRSGGLGNRCDDCVTVCRISVMDNKQIAENSCVRYE